MKSHILGSAIFFENRAVYEIMRKNTVELDRPQITIQHGACALHAVYLRLDTHTHTHTHTHSEYVIIIDFPMQ